MVSLPAILGHEGSGVLADGGKGVMSIKPGDHVAPLWRLSCRNCEFVVCARAIEDQYVSELSRRAAE
jgi:Zn-dependent alcohol dehydrogenase